MPRHISEPSAPPMHLMEPCEEELAERSPPPRYEEAIASDQPVSAHSFFPAPSLPAHHQDQANLRRRNPQQRCLVATNNTCQHGGQAAERRSMFQLDRLGGGSSQQCLVDSARGHEARRPRRNFCSASGRHNSASPGGLSDGESEDEEPLGRSSSRPTARSSAQSHGPNGDASIRAKSKRTSGSKIKRGLENIAFFIIQILD